MKTIFYYLTILSLIMNACSSGKKALEQGNYYDAVLKSVDRLRKNTGHDKSKSTLRKSYPLAIAYYEDEIRNITSSNASFKWGRTVRSYELINNMYEQIRRSPAAIKVIANPLNYYDKLERATNNAAEESYQAGLRKLNPNDRNLSKEAYYHFNDANNFINGYRDSRDKMAEAHFHATLKVVVEQIPVPRRYSLSGDFFQQKIEEYLHNGWSDREFVRFFNPTEAQNKQLQKPDQILILAFDDFSVGDTYIRESTEQFVRDSVKVGEVTLEDGKKIPAHNSVKAKLTIFKQEVVSQGVLSMRIVDGTNEAILASTQFPGTFVWFTEWATFNGDERALTNEQLALCKKTEILPPSPQNMFIEFTVPIYDQLTSALRRFYQRY